MAVKFDPSTGLSITSAAEDLETVGAAWQSAFSADGQPPLDIDTATPAGQLIATEAALVHRHDTDLLFLANMFNPETAEGVWQDALCKIYFLQRKLAEHTIVDCSCSGLYNTRIPAGSIVQSADGYQLRSLADATIPNTGTATVEFAVTEPGPIPIGAHSVTKIVTVIPGWDSVDNNAAGAQGRNAETRSELETRRYRSVAANAVGSVAALRAALSALDGVLDCEVIENTTNETITSYGIQVAGHSVAICIFGGDVAGIARVIYQKKSAGCGTVGETSVTYTDPSNNITNTYQILRPTATPVKIRVTLAQSASILNTVQDDLSKALVDDFYGRGIHERVGLAQTLYSSRFYSVAVEAVGLADLLSIEVALGSGEYGSSITINGNVEPTLDAADVTVVIEE